MKHQPAFQGWRRRGLKALQWVAVHLGWRVMDERLAMLSRLGYWPHLKHPRSFNEKLGHRKLFDRNPLYTILADKVAFRGFVEERLGPGYLVPVLGVFNGPDDIPWDELPSSFVIKTNHRSGGNLLVPDKARLDVAQAQATLRKWFDEPYGQDKYEWFYDSFPRKILIETFLRDPVTEYPLDYKVYVFHGRVEFIHVDLDRFIDHRRNFYDRQWVLQPFSSQVHTGAPVSKPDNLDELIRVAEALAKGFSFMRVDLYSVEGRVYAGEMTMTPSSGRKAFHPQSYDFWLGAFWKMEKE